MSSNSAVLGLEVANVSEPDVNWDCWWWDNDEGTVQAQWWFLRRHQRDALLAVARITAEAEHRPRGEETVSGRETDSGRDASSADIDDKAAVGAAERRRRELIFHDTRSGHL